MSTWDWDLTSVGGKQTIVNRLTTAGLFLWCAELSSETFEEFVDLKKLFCYSNKTNKGSGRPKSADLGQLHSLKKEKKHLSGGSLAFIAHQQVWCQTIRLPYQCGSEAGTAVARPDDCNSCRGSFQRVTCPQPWFGSEEALFPWLSLFSQTADQPVVSRTSAWWAQRLIKIA